MHTPWAGSYSYKISGLNTVQGSTVSRYLLTSLPFCVRFNVAVTRHAATLDTGPVANSYPDGSPTHLFPNHFQYARAFFCYSICGDKVLVLITVGLKQVKHRTSPSSRSRIRKSPSCETTNTRQESIASASSNPARCRKPSEFSGFRVTLASIIAVILDCDSFCGTSTTESESTKASCVSFARGWTDILAPNVKTFKSGSSTKYPSTEQSLAMD
jgi:hypothetical protein